MATTDPMVASLLQGIFHRGLLRVYTNHDVVGCELGGALKNVVAIAAGMAQGLDVGDNTGRPSSPGGWPNSPNSASRWAVRPPPSPG